MNLTIIEAAVERISPSPFNPRRVRDTDDAVKELAASISAVGLLSPITIRIHPEAKDGKFDHELVCGERRWRAVRLGGATKITAMVRQLDDAAAREVAVTENMQREDLTPIEEARGVATLMSSLSLKEVADRLGKPERWIARRAAIANLAPLIVSAFEDARSPIAAWSARHLELVARLPRPVQESWWRGLEKWSRPRLAHESVSELEESLSRLRRSLGDAPWEMAECGNCQRRTGAQPALFDDSPRRGDQCLDAACWEAKMRKHSAAAVAAARAKHEKLVVLDGRGYARTDEKTVAAPDGREYEYRNAKKGEKGVVAAIVLKDGGAVSAVKWVMRGAAATVGEARPKADPAAVRERKRIRHMCEALGKILDTKKYEDLTIERPRQVFVLALSFRCGYRNDADWKRFEREKGLKLDELGERVWRELVEDEVRGLVHYNALDVPDLKQIEWVAQLVGADYKALRAAAQAAVPEPMKGRRGKR